MVYFDEKFDQKKFRVVNWLAILAIAKKSNFVNNPFRFAISQIAPFIFEHILQLCQKLQENNDKELTKKAFDKIVGSIPSVIMSEIRTRWYRDHDTPRTL